MEFDFLYIYNKSQGLVAEYFARSLTRAALGQRVALKLKDKKNALGAALWEQLPILDTSINFMLIKSLFTTPNNFQKYLHVNIISGKI